ncbi:MAG: hypothetical protein LBC30_03200 [Puniceicoccales bacterium]|nr:hypothetical protein [Puniceicoccales bacterium]
MPKCDLWLVADRILLKLRGDTTGRALLVRLYPEVKETSSVFSESLSLVAGQSGDLGTACQ